MTKFRNFLYFLSHTKREMKRVHWLKFREAVKQANITVLFVFIILGFFLLIDMLMSMLVG